MRLFCFSMITLAALMAPVAPAPEAAIIKGRIDFDAEGFPVDAPVQSVFGYVDFSIDSSVSVTNKAGAARVGALNLAFNPFAFVSYDASLDTISILISLQRLAALEQAGDAKLKLEADRLREAAQAARPEEQDIARFKGLTLEAESTGLALTALSGSVSFTPIAEPAALATLGVGLAGLALVRRRHPSKR
jgi:hypothetical protein